MARVREAIAGAAERASSAADVERAVLALRGDEGVVRLVYESRVLADLAGQMFVRLVEVCGETRLLARSHAARVVSLAAADRLAFLRMPFEEALAWWVERGGSPEILEEVLAAWRRRAGEDADAMFDTLAARAVEEIERVLRDGGTFRDFASAIRDESITLGIAPADSSYLETVFRTNVQSAYGAGRWTQMNEPDVIAARPYRQWVATMDSRTRPGHAVLDGVVWRHDDPSFANVAAPGGFNCRCAVITLSEEEREEQGLEVSTAVPPGADIADGFGVAGLMRGR